MTDCPHYQLTDPFKLNQIFVIFQFLEVRPSVRFDDTLDIDKENKGCSLFCELSFVKFGSDYARFLILRIVMKGRISVTVLLPLRDVFSRGSVVLSRL